MKIFIPVLLFIYLLISVKTAVSDNIDVVNGSTLTACTGILYDSGGPAGDYLDGEDYSVTLSPTGAGTVQVTFVLFDVEAQPACNRDYIKIYDGPNAGSPLIGTYCNSNIPTTITSTAGSLHFVWHSNAINVFAGFEMNWIGKITVTPSVFQNISCNGASDGSLTAVANLGSIPYTYQWYDDALMTNLIFTGQTPPGLTANTYYVKATDLNGCNATATQVLTQPTALSGTLAKTDVTCFGSNNGTITVTASGGSGSWEYSRNGGGTWQASNIFTLLPAGTYDVRIRDAANPTCVATLNTTYVISQPAILNATVTPTNVSICNGNNNGSIVMSVPSGGSGSYQYTINGGANWQSSASFTGLIAGGYNVRIRDANVTTCTRVLNGALVLTQPTAITATLNSTNANCYNTASGSINITAPSGGGGTYDYSNNGGTSWQGSGAFNSLSAGMYNVKIRDAVNTTCVITLNGALTITEPAILSGTISAVDVSVCNGNNNGSITINASAGGGGTYQYSIDGGGTWQNPNSFTSLLAGIYNVQIRDLVTPTCVVTLNTSQAITQPTALSGTLAKTDVTCFGSNNGSITVTASGGSGAWQYTRNGGGAWQAGNSFTLLPAGSYDVRIRDAANPTCTATLNAAYVITQPAVLNATVTPTNVTICNGNNNGSIVMSAPSGGSGSYQYTINGGANWQSSVSFTGLIAGTYDVRIRDANATTCSIVLNGALVITQPAAITATLNSTNSNCFGASNGSISITAPVGGSGSYGYSINGGTSWLGAGTFNSLSSGMYNVKIRDAVNTTCVVTLNGALTITEPAVLSGTIAAVNVTVCNGNNNGSITINAAAGGGGTYQYSINGGGAWQNPNSFTSLTAGTYDVRIRDMATPACVVTLNATQAITQPTALSGTLAKTDVTCFGSNNGSITVTASGGSGAWQYTRNGGGAWQAGNSFTLLPAGTYDVRIRDAANPTCTATINGALVISQPLALGGTINAVNVSICNGTNNGSISVTAAVGGSGSYNYSIDGGTNWQTSNVFSGLIAGTYNVQIQDILDPACISILNATQAITEPSLLNATLNKTDVNCFDAPFGSINITASAGGSGSYQYSINGGSSWQAGSLFNLLYAGTYNVLMRDAANTSCVKILNSFYTITQPNILDAAISVSNVTDCFGSNTGSISLIGATGGNGTYEYSIDGGTSWQAGTDFLNLTAGTYDVRIRDMAVPVCEITLNSNQEILQPVVLSGSLVKTDVSCFGSADGSITVFAAGGSGTWQYSINGGGTWQASDSFSLLPAGTYDVRVRDALNNGCVLTLNNAYTISQPLILSASITQLDVSVCYGSNNGSIAINGAAGGSGLYDYSIDGGINWQSNNTFSGLDVGIYDVLIRDAGNISCIISLNSSLTISQPIALSAGLNKTDVSCYNALTGVINIIGAAGGSSNFEYSIDGGTNWQLSNSFTSLAAGIYNVVMRDALNITCIKTLNNYFTITQPNILFASILPTNVSDCSGSNTGSITINGSTGGSGSYEYTIDGGFSWQAGNVFLNLTAGSYDVRIRDLLVPSCEIILNSAQIISQPIALSGSLSKTDILCFGVNNGMITVQAYGASGSYEYTIDGGVNWQVSNIFAGLTSGTYNVLVRDALNPSCALTLNPAYVITQPAILNAGITSTDVTVCNGNNNGSILCTGPTGGSLSYEYTINGGVNWQIAPVFSNLSAGTYNVKIRDANVISCEIVLNNALILSQPAALSANVSSVNSNCYNTQSGSIDITSPLGGSGIFEYSINGGTSWQPGGTFSNLNAGLYNVIIRDASNPSCVVTLNGALTILQPNILSATIVSVNVSACFGNSNGSIGLNNPLGGSGTYEFSINGGTSWQVLNSFINLPAGIYDTRIRDISVPTCSVTLSSAVILSQPAPLAATVNFTNIGCNGATDGTITLTASTGGYGTYEYSINNGTTWQSSPVFNNLAAATYQVLMRDATYPACVTTLNSSLTLTQQSSLSYSITSTPISCAGYNDGSAMISANGGMAPYLYLWDDALAQNTQTAVNLVANTYNCIVTDFHGCTIIGTVSIADPPQFGVNISLTQPIKCFGDSDAVITVAETNGLNPYMYSWNDMYSQNTQSADSIPAGQYIVSVTDAKGCNATDTITVTQPPFFNFNFAMGVVSTFSHSSYTPVTFSNDTVIPLGGVFTGVGIYNNTFIPALCDTPGRYFITYTYTQNSTGCTKSMFDTVYVVTTQGFITSAQLDTLPLIYCFDGPLDTLVGHPMPNPVIGYFTDSKGLLQNIGNNMALVDPSQLGKGNDTIIYHYDYNGAPLVVEKILYVDSVGKPSFSGLLSAYCSNGAPSSLTAINPVTNIGTGLWSGDVPHVGTNTNSFTPHDTLLGIDTVKYIFTSAFGCTNQFFMTTVVNPAPVVDFSISTPCATDTIQFTDLTVATSIASWNWNFGDNSVPATVQNPTHVYQQVGQRNIRLFVITVDACSNFKDSIISFGFVPTPLFSWKNECVNSSVIFQNNSIIDPIDSTYYLWDFGDNTTSSLKNPVHHYGAVGNDTVRLTLITPLGCNRSVQHIIHIRPVISSFPAEETFESGAQGWISESINPLKNSWNLRNVVDPVVPAPYSGILAWYTRSGSDSSYYNNEKSFVTSPCYNFDSLSRPMIKMKVYNSTEKGYDGASLQYTLDNGTTWLTLGGLDDGINWYNDIFGNAGQQQIGWSDTLTTWIDVRHDLNNLADSTNVQFRIAFASSDNNIMKGFAFDDVWIGEKPRKVLFEHFTNANYLASASWDDVFNNWVIADKRDVIDIQYHTSFPEADKLNQDNPDDPSARTLYYGVSQVPYSLMDGNYYFGATTNWLIPTNYYRNYLVKRRLTDPQFDISLNKSVTGSNVNVFVKVQSKTFTGNATLQLAVLEKKIERTDVGNNGQTIFSSVLKKMLPDAGGSFNLFNWGPGIADSLNISCSLSGFYNISDSNNIVIVAFVQDDVTKEIYQAATTDTSAGVIYVEPNAAESIQDFIAYPNPSDGSFAVLLKNPSETDNALQIFNSIGELVYTKKISKGTSGSSVDLSSISAGMYYIRLLSDSKIIGSKKVTIYR